jgi:hypothetical protein
MVCSPEIYYFTIVYYEFGKRREMHVNVFDQNLNGLVDELRALRTNAPRRFTQPQN